MNLKKAFCTLTMLLLASAILQPITRADEFDQATEVTFSGPVEVPGQVLPPGTYWFETLGHSVMDSNVVRIFNWDRSSLIATVRAIPAEHLMKAADETIMTLAERPSDQPGAVMNWFYPGRNIGHEFVYPANEQTDLTTYEQESLRISPNGTISSVQRSI